MALAGRVAFVTGAAQGLGKAFSQALLQRGARVCLTDVQANTGKQVESAFQEEYGKDNVLFLECDVSSSERLKDTFKSALARFGHIDLMVNNAGIADESRLKDMININLAGAIQGSMLALEHMRRDKGGKGGVIINVASTAGLTGVFFSPGYCAVKFGLVGFHQSWSGNPHLNEMGVQFGCLCPAFTDTAIINFDEGRVLYMQEGLKFLKKVGINNVEVVVQGFLSLVESENCNGDIVTVTARDGIQYQKKGRNKQSRL